MLEDILACMDVFAFKKYGYVVRKYGAFNWLSYTLDDVVDCKQKYGYAYNRSLWYSIFDIEGNWVIIVDFDSNISVVEKVFNKKVDIDGDVVFEQDLQDSAASDEIVCFFHT